MHQICCATCMRTQHFRRHSNKPRIASMLQLAKIDFTLAYNALPCAVDPPQGANPLIPRALRACFKASHHFFKGLVANAFLARIEAFRETIFPVLLRIRVDLVRPLTVRSFLPLKTAALARAPLAITLTRFAFFAVFFIAVFFIGLAFIATFFNAMAEKAMQC